MSGFGETFDVVGRKDHRCEWCGGLIPRGERHRQFKGMFESQWQNWKMHAECYDDAHKSGALYEGFTPHDGDRPQRIRELEATRGA